MKYKRNPRRSIVDVRTECVPYGQALVSVSYCVLKCGHKIEGYPDTLDGRKACPECGRKRKRGSDEGLPSDIRPGNGGARCVT